MSLQSFRTVGWGSDEIDRQIAELSPWFHNLHLPSGHHTAPDHPLGDFPAFKWEQIAPTLPDDMTGVPALDIGCNAGYYSFQLAQRGASVLAIDVDPHYLRQARWAAPALDPDGRISFRQAPLYELAEIDDRFELILFLGVLYHLRYPLLALDLVATLLRGRLIFQTLTMPGGEGDAAVPANLGLGERARLAEPGWPRAAFVEHAMAGDPTNWWVPDDACVRAMLRSSGMQVVATPGHELYVCEPVPGGCATDAVRNAELRTVLRPRRSVQSPAPSQRK